MSQDEPKQRLTRQEPETDRERGSTSPGSKSGRSASASERAALLLIHGIGEQRPYQVLDVFVRGLANAWELEPGSAEHHLVHRAGSGQDQPGSRSLIRLRLPEDRDLSGVRELDLYEFYWAGLVQGRIRLREVLRWIAKTSLTPLRSWAHQVDILLEEKTAGPKVLIFLREIGRSLLLVVISALIITPFLYAAVQNKEIRTTAGELWRIVAGIQQPWWLAVWVLLVFSAIMILLGLFRMLRREIAQARRLKEQTSVTRETGSWWASASVISFVVLLALAILLSRATDLNVRGLGGELLAAVSSGAVLGLTLALAASWITRGFLRKYVGDIALYVTADERSAFFRTRADILGRSSTFLRELLLDPSYRQVFVAGHSLGSVIAYDTLNAVGREVRSEIHAESASATENKSRTGAPGIVRPKDWDRLKGLLTFGSPLDKVYYFFRTTVRHEESVRAQLLASLHGFRSRESRKTDSEMRSLYANLWVKESKALPEPASFRWLNVYSWADPVSGELDFYRLDQPLDRQVRLIGTLHSRYWRNPAFYEAVQGWLCGNPGDDPVASAPPREGTIRSELSTAVDPSP